MFARDLMVAAIAIGLGLFLIVTALVNHQRTFEIRTLRYWTEVYGRTGARWLIGTIGFIVLLLGTYILCEPWLSKAISTSRIETDEARPDLAIRSTG